MKLSDRYITSQATCHPEPYARHSERKSSRWYSSTNSTGAKNLVFPQDKLPEGSPIDMSGNPLKSIGNLRPFQLLRMTIYCLEFDIKNSLILQLPGEL